MDLLHCLQRSDENGKIVGEETRLYLGPDEMSRTKLMSTACKLICADNREQTQVVTAVVA